MSTNGKGSRPRPVNGEKFRANFERIFGKRKIGVARIANRRMPTITMAKPTKSEMEFIKSRGKMLCEICAMYAPTTKRKAKI